MGSKIQGRCHFLEGGSFVDFICAFRLMTIPDFLCHLPKPLPIRDLRVFLRSRSSRSRTLGPHRKPTLVPRSSHLILYTGKSHLSLCRPASGCYIFDMEHIRFLCYTDRCLILDPERPLLQSFLGLLSSDLNGKGDTRSHIRHLYQVDLHLTEVRLLKCLTIALACPRIRHLLDQTLSTLSWKLPWPVLSTNSTGGPLFNLKF